ncbi:hypothetical protein PAA8504_04062 [Palleronia abyssalis]|uniref:HTH arsR-type domain-containing protein n=2 Tax=Palleronia abyssalis TaxID=1501240 RepID=A0A2R8C1L5_9RHOB|nr:hypothetical protein PAA8504_04062 [Palleronia abyssalis]
MTRKYLMITPDDGQDVLRCLAVPARLQILKLLHASGAMNVNEIAETLSLPQSSASIHVTALEEAGLIITTSQKARRGSQKICTAAHAEILLSFGTPRETNDAIEVSMPVGLYSGAEVLSPCGLCSDSGIIGYLDSPATFLNPERMRAGLLWFTRGHVDYQFPNNARIAGRTVTELELRLELSSEVPGTSANWPSDITVEINGKPIGCWTAPGDYGDRRGVHTPSWWKLAGSQYGHLKSFRVTADGTYLDGVRLSDVGLAALDLESHHSIRVRIAVHDDAEHPGGINIFGRGFGNYDQDIVLTLNT